ncbi:AAA domain-containing protein [Ruegeria halocynthiae]|uniref:AAA domain-containing protein n=1 Tax=Ruegeria halocynthiae TaxID=985054 RepID=A0A1H3DBX8_9RHOB|nr:AAA family ATPase [Ruegeria halocynthiae]SDX63169.1 AAA domain-containing protein [Ruegeria halocynthiae]
MTHPQNTVVLKELAVEIAARATGSRIIVALAGAPGSGKSTLAELLQNELRKSHDQKVQIVPMDGFHFDDAILAQLGRSQRKGAPDTFDVEGLEVTLNRLASTYLTADVAVPVFDRTMELSRAGARLIDRNTRILLVEGNYLLLKDSPWKRLHQFFDLAAMITCHELTLRKRLQKRWNDFGFSQLDAIMKLENNDLPNAMRVIEGSVHAEFILLNE